MKREIKRYLILVGYVTVAIGVMELLAGKKRNPYFGEVTACFVHIFA